MALQKKVYETPELEFLTLTVPEELAALSVDDIAEEPQAFAMGKSGVWTPWV